MNKPKINHTRASLVGALVLGILSACNMNLPEEEDYYVQVPYYLTQASENPLLELTKNLHDNLEYVNESQMADLFGTDLYWMSPKETAELQRGDCKAQTLYEMALANELYGIKSEMNIINVLVGYKSLPDPDTPRGHKIIPIYRLHAVMGYNGIWYDPVGGIIRNPEDNSAYLWDTYSWDVAMKKATDNWRK